MPKQVKIYFFLSVAALALFLSCCASLQEPDSTHSALVVGAIVMNAKGLESYNGATVNGTHRGGVVITFVNTSTNDKYVVSSNSDGLFYSAEIPAGNYVIKRCYYKATSGNNWADWYMMLEGSRHFAVEDGTVNNLGLIIWDVSGEEGNHYTLNKDYAKVHEQLSKTFPKSGWLSLPWKDTTVT